ncbi:MAG: nucleotidyltransferase domain-containing protein [bacterium]
MNAIRYLRERVEANGVHVDRMVLFGSHAKGKAADESDIDVVIISEDFRRKNRFKRTEMTWRAEWETIKKFRVPFDIVTMTPEEFDRGDTIIADYAREGKVVYAA